MILGEVIAIVAKFMQLVAAKEYEAATALEQAPESTFVSDLRDIWSDLLDDIGEMPPDGWKSVWLQGPIEAPEGLRVYVDVPVWDTHGEDMGWYFKFALSPGFGEEWRIEYVHTSN